MVQGDDPPLYCPFEADWFARNKGSPVDFSAGEDHVVTPEEYLPAATERGTCPHRVMSVLLENADVVVGNYNHLFDPGTRPLLASILDSKTFLVVDEAHRLGERVRDLLSDRVGRDTLVRARNDCAQLVTRARESDQHRQAVRERLATHDVPLSAVQEAREFYDDLLGWLDDRVATYLDGVDREHFQLRATGRTVDYLSDFQVVVQGHVGPALDAFCHCVCFSRCYLLKTFEHIRTVSISDCRLTASQNNTRGVAEFSIRIVVVSPLAGIVGQT
jgi:Rad3-related DNA helicase